MKPRATLWVALFLFGLGSIMPLLKRAHFKKRLSIPAVLGMAFAGGFYAGQITLGAVKYAIVAAPKATGEMLGTLTNTNQQISAYSSEDSITNTQTLKTLGGLALTVDNINIGGNSDWYVPSIAVMNAVANNLRPSRSDIDPLFRSGGAEALISANYWSSTCYDWIEDNSWYEEGAPIYDTVNDVTSTSEEGWIPEGEQAYCAGSIENAVWLDGPMVENGITYYKWSWDCVITTPRQVIIGYEDGVWHEDITNHFDAYVINPVNLGLATVSKTSSCYVRAVRLVPI